MARPRVAIVGAGLGGLLLAVALEKYAPDLEVNIYECASQLTEAGAGITMPPRIWTMMCALGLDKSLLEIRGNNPDEPEMVFTYRKSDQQEGVDFHKLNPTQNVNTYHRAQVQAVLAKHLKSTVLHLAKRLTKYDQPDDVNSPIELSFQDGTTATCDLLVGSDGVKSVVRREMYTALADKEAGQCAYDEAAAIRDYINPIWSGLLVYRTLIPKAALVTMAPHPAFHNPILYCGKNGSCMCYPINQGRVLNVGFTVNRALRTGVAYEGPLVTHADKQELITPFSGWESELNRVLEACPENTLRWAVHMVKPLPTYVDRRVALIGDAAHAMIQFQGSGAGQAFEDGFLLAHLLAHPKLDVAMLPAALRAFDQIRRPFSQAVAERSLLTERLAHFRAGTNLEELSDAIERSMDWMSATSVADDCAAAIQLFEQGL